VYLGQQVEYAAMDQAVAATAGQVLTHEGAIVQAVYSANAGGHLASTREGFGKGAFDVPYLRPTPYPTRDPRPWTVEIAVADVGRRLGYPGTAERVTASQTGPSGRVLELTIEGDAGPMTADAVAGRLDLGLRSNLFSVRVEQRDQAPQPPPPLDGAQTGGDLSAARLPSSARGVGRSADGLEPSSGDLSRGPWVTLALLALAAAGGGHLWWRRRLSSPR
jgi:SpoIID/LytB domain protein